MPWLTPNTPAPSDSFCRRISIPNDQVFIQAISGALIPLTYENNWESSGTMTPREAAETMRTALIDFFAAVGCPTLPAPYWDSASSVDDEQPADTQAWYGVVQNFLAPIESLNFVQNLAVWAITGFVAYAAGPGAAIFFRTVARRFIVAVQAGDAGGIIRVVVDSAEYDVDTSLYAPGDIIEIPVVTTLENPTHDILIIGTGGNTRVIRKRFDEEEMDAITDIQQVAGQLQIVRGGTGVWENVPNADNLRLNGSTTMTGSLNVLTGAATGGAINVNPNASQLALNIQLPVTTISDVMRIRNAGGVAVYSVNSIGRQSARGDDNAMYNIASNDGTSTFTVGTLPGNAILTVRGRTGQSGELLRALSSTGVLMAAISASGGIVGRGGLTLRGASSIQERDMVAIRSVWEISTDATRRAQVVISAFDTSERELIRGGTNGAAATLAFFGGSPVARPAVTGERNGNPALASLLSALGSLNLIDDTTTPGSSPFVPGELAVTGERNGNPALASLLDALSEQGIVWNQTTEGTGSDVVLFTKCNVSQAIANGAMDDMRGVLTYAVGIIQLEPGIFASAIANDYREKYAAWMTERTRDDLEAWLIAVGDPAADRLAIYQSLLVYLVQQAYTTEVRRLAWCSIDAGCPAGTTAHDFAVAIEAVHNSESQYEAFASFIDVLPTDRIAYLAMNGALCDPSPDCSAFECEGMWSTDFTPFDHPEGASYLVVDTPFSTVIGREYKATIEGYWHAGTPIEVWVDACYRSFDDWGTHESYGTIDYVWLMINGVLQGGALPYTATHKYEFTVIGTGAPIQFRWRNSAANTAGGAVTLTVVGLGI